MCHQPTYDLAHEFDHIRCVGGTRRRALHFRDKPISGDQALQPLQNIVGVRKLNLDNSPVTDAALQGLGPMPELRDLSLTRTAGTLTPVTPIHRTGTLARQPSLSSCVPKMTARRAREI